MVMIGSARVLRRLSVALAVGATAASLAACDAAPGAGSSGEAPRHVTVVGSGTVDGTPDTFTAEVAVSFTAPEATTALNLTNERQDAVLDALVGTGIDRDDITTTKVGLQPQLGGPDNDTVTGYQATNAITVNLNDTSAAPRMLALITSIGGDATRINSVSYSIDDDSQLLRDARSRAFEDARNRAEQYAELSGLDLGEVLSISEEAGGSTPPTPMPRGVMAATDVPLSPGTQEVGFAVTVVWELR